MHVQSVADPLQGPVVPRPRRFALHPSTRVHTKSPCCARADRPGESLPAPCSSARFGIRYRVSVSHAVRILSLPCHSSAYSSHAKQVQEAWAFRAGLFHPLLLLLAHVEAALLECGVARGAHEPWPVAALKSLLLATLLVVNLLVQGWLPLLRAVLWDPKPKISAALREAGLLHSVSGTEEFRAQSQWPGGPWGAEGTGPVLMDSGLLICSSHEPDSAGFVPFGAKGNSEAVAWKGMLWARWNDMVVLNTHMTFVNADGGVQRQRQREELAGLVSFLLKHGCPRTGSRVDRVILAGDLNHCLPTQACIVPQTPKSIHLSIYLSIYTYIRCMRQGSVGQHQRARGARRSIPRRGCRRMRLWTISTLPWPGISMCVCVCVCVHVYIYVYL